MLQTNLCGIKLENPTILASGILGVTKPSIDRIGKSGAGAVTIKSLCHEERPGNKNPTMFGYDGVFLNAVGLSGQGIDSALEDFKTFEDVSVPVVASLFGYTVEQFGEVAEKMATLKPAMIEVNISCPNIDYGVPYHGDPKLAAKITKLVKKKVGKIPVSIKLSPNTHDIAGMAKACEKAGADAITAINTATGMKINVDARKPVLMHKVGGLSGPALHPIAVACVYEIYKAVKIPIIGTGGVDCGMDALEMIMAGATAVGVGSGAYYEGLGVFKKITDEMREWMRKNKVKRLDEIRGCAHQ